MNNTRQFDNSKGRRSQSSHAKVTPWSLRLMLAAGVAVYCTAPVMAQTLSAPFNSDFSIDWNRNINSILPGGNASATVVAFAPGQNDTVYVGTENNGILAFNYDPMNAANPITARAQGALAVATTNFSQSSGRVGSLGFDFHQDPTHGLVMYYAPNHNQSETLGFKIMRSNDSNGNGVFGDPGDPGNGIPADTLNQTLVNNLRAGGIGNHRIENLQIRGDSLFVNIGTRTQNGGVDVDGRSVSAQQFGGLQAGEGEDANGNPVRYSSGGRTSSMGEYAYTGALNFVEDVTQIGAGANAAGFSIPNTIKGHSQATEFFTSTDPGKLRVYATGFRNNFGLGINNQGEIFVSENQNEFPDRLVPDRVLKVENFKDDFGYQKSNGYIDDTRVAPDLTSVIVDGVNGNNGTGVYDIVGTYRDPGGSAEAAAAAAAGYFQQTAALSVGGDADTTDISLADMQAAAFGLIIGDASRNASVTGLGFVSDHADNAYAGDILAATFVRGNVRIIDKDTGVAQLFATGISAALDVELDPFGNNLLVSRTGQITLVSTNLVPEPTSAALVGLGSFIMLGLKRRRHRKV